jgi:predicted RNA-binding Zn ribbon-like protein
MESTRPDHRERIRWGGRVTPEGFLFELSGGALCLDFVNTGEPGPEGAPQELLGRYGDLVSWGLQAGALAPQEARLLERLAAKRPHEARAALERARDVREELYTLFSGRAADRPLPPKSVAAAGAAIAEALSHLRLHTDRSRAAWTWSDDPHLDRVLWPVLRSAGELLTSDELGRVRECASETCAWLFLDRSRNASRRWCDMTTCGNRDKVRRHRERQREG